jgi:hypothetical protein
MSWRTGDHYQGLVIRITNDDLDRVGQCWMRGRLREGDLAMAIRHCGDCFWEYQLIECASNGCKLIPQSEFGAYVLGMKYPIQPTKREAHLLLAGERVTLEIQNVP